jgi:predicted Zn-dependent protease
VYKGIHKLTLGAGALDFIVDTVVAGISGSAAAIAVPPDAPDPLENAKWASNAITWSFATGNLTGQPVPFSDPMTGVFATLAEKAMQMWETVANISLTQVTDSSASDIRIGFENLPGTTIGLTNWNSFAGFFSTDVTVGVEDTSAHAVTALADGDFVYSGLASEFFQVIAHELGHALGLDHNVIDSQALMQPAATALNRSIDPNDVTAIQQLYGASASGNPNVSITDGGPDAFNVAAGSSIHPFSGLTVADGFGLNETVTVTMSGDGTLSDPTAGTDASFANGVFRESGVNLSAVDEAQLILDRLAYTAGTSGEASFTVAVGNSLDEAAVNSNVTIGSIIPTIGSTTPTFGFAVVDTTTGMPVTAIGQPYVGPVAGLSNQYINITTDSLNISASTPGWFIHSGSGTDALAVSSGTNVLDGGAGSNFLTGGSGTDTFFVDDRAATTTIWSTVVGFHGGDSATIWGVTPQDFTISFADNQGTSSFTGLTVHATAAGKPAASLTLAAFSQADMTSGRVSVTFGTDTASGSSFMFLHANS